MKQMQQMLAQFVAVSKAASTAPAPAPVPARPTDEIPRGLFLEIEVWGPEEESGPTIGEFLEAFEGATTELTPKARLRFLKNRLKGSAKNLVADQATGRTDAETYTQLVKDLHGWFGREDPDKAAETLWTSQRKSGEKLRHFAERIRRLARRAAEAEIVEERPPEQGADEFRRAQDMKKQEWAKKRTLKVFLKGLNPDLKVLLLGNPPTSIEDALLKAEEFEDSLASTGSELSLNWDINAVGNGPRKCYTCGSTEHFAARCPKATTAPAKPAETPVKPAADPVMDQPKPRHPCIYCGARDHFPIYCRHSDVFCDFCGMRGHLERDCFKKQRRQPPTLADGERPGGRRLESVPAGTTAAIASSVPAKESTSTTDAGNHAGVNTVKTHRHYSLTVLVTVNGKRREMLLDTGAAVTCLSHPVEGVPVQPTTTRLWAADGRELPVRGTQTLEFGIGGARYLHDALIFKNSSAGLDLLGWDLLSIFPIILNTHTRRAYIEDPRDHNLVPLGQPDSETSDLTSWPKMLEEGWSAFEESAPLVGVMSSRPGGANEESGAVQADFAGALEVPTAERIEEPRDEFSIGGPEEGSMDELPPELWDRPQPTINERINAVAQHLTGDAKRKLEALLRKRPALFERPTGDGCTFPVSHGVDTGDAAPIPKRSYPVPHHLRPVVEEQIGQMLTDGVIVPSKSPWNAPVVMVKKKVLDPEQPPEWRFCTDYRDLNKVTKTDAYPLPRLLETLEALGKSRYYSTLDLTMGYHQIPMEDASKEKTAFSTLGRHYQYEKMPFGLKNAPATFQRAMNDVLGELLREGVMVYLDDVVIHSPNLTNHLELLDKVLQRFQDTGFKVNLKKCHFLKQEVGFLGHVVTIGGVKMDPSKVSAVRECAAPRDVKQLQAFLGLAGFYRRFVAGYSGITAPLTQLLKKNTPFQWGEEQQTAFQNIKDALQQHPILAYPDLDKPFTLATDASLLAVGAVLSQTTDQGDRPIAYASRKLNPAETRYSATERELLAVVWAIRHFQEYLLGTRFVLETDHRALTCAMKTRDPTSRIGRWILRLTEYDFEAKHRPGSQMAHADALSRPPMVEEPIVVGAATLSVPQDLLRVAQEMDPWIQTNAKNPPDGMTQVEGLWIMGLPNRPAVPVIPGRLVNWYLQHCHANDWAGHPGVSATEEIARRHGYWNTLRRDVRDYVQRCQRCQRRNTPGGVTPPAQVPTLPERPGQIVGIDFVGPLPAGRTTQYLLTAVDHFTKYAEAYVVPDCTANTAAEVLATKFIPTHGTPESLVSDRGTAFTSQLLVTLCREWNVRKIITSAYHPQANGVCERFHRTLANIVAKICNETNKWERVLPLALAAYRATPHSSTGETPNLLTFGRELRLPHLTEMETDLAPEPYLVRPLQKVWKIVAQELKRHAQHRADTLNQRRTLHTYDVGQLVFYRRMVPPAGECKKFWSPWIGPCLVLRQTTPVNYLIKEPTGRETKVHAIRLKPAFGCESGGPAGAALATPVPGPAPVINLEADLEDEYWEKEQECLELLRTAVPPPTLATPPLSPLTGDGVVEDSPKAETGTNEETGDDDPSECEEATTNDDTADPPTGPGEGRYPSRDRKPPARYGDWWE